MGRWGCRSASKIRNLQPPVTPIKRSDSHGLYLHVKPTGSRFWFFRYYFCGKETRRADLSTGSGTVQKCKNADDLF
ncbi:Arm DNA-binding domain-containing protein [Samsonia erythrinae]